MNLPPVAYRIGTKITKAYLNHLLWFTIGGAATAFETFVILSPFIHGACRTGGP